MGGDVTETVQQAARRFAAPMLAKGYRPEGLYQYTAPDGTMTHARMRLKNPETGDKYIRPLRLNGTIWELREPEFSDGKPLYRLHELAQRPASPVWWVEGEPKADALAKLGLLATTAGSATSDEGAEFDPMAGHAATIWPDNDKPGMEHGARVAAKLRALGCNVETIEAAALDLSKGGDCVDWLKAHPGATAADLAKLPRVRVARVTCSADGLVLTCIADVEAKPIRWLWPGRIARGKVALLAGHPGLGKSQVTISIAATVSTGGTWPVDGARCERGSVILLNAEDDVADTIRPRLEAAGADLNRVHVLDAVRVASESGKTYLRGFSLADDVDRLGALLDKLPDVALIVIDPVSAYLGAVDSHKNADVRALLTPLAEMAARHGVAVVAVSHLSKSSGTEALLRVQGSIAFSAAARAVWGVARDKDNAARRLFLPLKNNLGNDQTGLAFAIEGFRLAGGIETSRVAWEGEAVTIAAEEAFAPEGNHEERNAVEDAREFLGSLLKAGPMPAKRVYAEAREAGYSERTVRRAQKALGVEAVKEGMQAGWQWWLPTKAAKNAEDGQTNNVDAFDDLGRLRETSGGLDSVAESNSEVL